MKKRFRELQAIVEEAIPELNRLKDVDVNKKPSPDKWSKKEILGHLIDSAANNHHHPAIRVFLELKLRFFMNLWFMTGLFFRITHNDIDFSPPSI